MANKKLQRQLRRKKRVSANMHGTIERPRVNIFRSNKYMYAQAVDDEARVTVASANSAVLKTKGLKTAQASQVGKNLADALKEKKITTVIFDRSRFAYAGRVKAVAEALRDNGIVV